MTSQIFQVRCVGCIQLSVTQMICFVEMIGLLSKLQLLSLFIFFGFLYEKDQICPNVLK
jgi:hypothetical protein